MLSRDCGGTRDEPEIRVDTSTTYDRVTTFIRSLIHSGELSPGDRLPPERELAQRLGISRITLQMALKMLQSTGYIVTTRGVLGGSRVGNTDSLVGCRVQWMDIHGEGVEDLVELLVTIGTSIAGLAAERRTGDELRTIEIAVSRYGGNCRSLSPLRGELDVHRAIALAAHSPRLAQAMIETRRQFFWPVCQAPAEWETEKKWLMHESLLAAIREQDAFSAIERMRMHLIQVRDLFERTTGPSTGSLQPCPVLGALVP